MPIQMPTANGKMSSSATPTTHHVNGIELRSDSGAVSGTLYPLAITNSLLKFAYGLSDFAV
jgi:hypothetical protein